MDKGEFPCRFKLKVYTNGILNTTIKTKDFGYLLSKKNSFKEEYSPDECEFKISRSGVIKTKKPRYKSFSNIPDDIAYYGVNSEGEYYSANEDYSKVTKLKEVF